MDIKFDIFEIEALLSFLKDYGVKLHLSTFNTIEVRYLFLAFIKLQEAKDTWEESMKYTE